MAKLAILEHQPTSLKIVVLITWQGEITVQIFNYTI